LLWLSLLSGCVVGVSLETTIDEPVDRIDVDLGQGGILVAAAPGPVTLKADLGGLGEGDLTYEVVDRVLYVTATCGELCGGEVELTAPRPTALTARVALGEIDVDGLGGELSLTMNTGSIRGVDLTGEVAVASAGTGDIDLQFVVPPLEVTTGTETGSVELEVPAGTYDLDLSAGRGRVDTLGVIHDPSSERRIRAWTQAGSVDVIGK
jgi:hypothetical protein